MRAIVAQGPRPACRPALDVGQGWEDEAMTHDPLCYWSKYIEPLPEYLPISRRKQRKMRAEIDGYCQCDLIARVRADERAKSLTVTLATLHN